MKTVLEYLEHTAALRPQAVAVEDASGTATFRELELACRKVGSALTACIAPGEPVAVLLEKGRTALFAFWGTVYAGGCYVPFNPDLPAPRLGQVQTVLGARYVITDGAHRALAEQLFPPAAVLDIADLLAAPLQPARLESVRQGVIDADPLYINFTSGSTGQPKGVVVSHRSVMDFIDVFTETFSITREDVLANQAPFDFDVSVKDLYTMLKTGARLTVVPKELFSRPRELVDWLCDRGATTLIWAVSALCLVSAFHGLDYRVPAGVNKVLFSGEVMPHKHLKAWRDHLPEATFVNLYGPTEITCNCTYHVLDPGRDYAGGIPIGKAFPNEEVFLLDDQDREITAPGITGELCVRGTALALGYCRAPAATAAAFVPDPRGRAWPAVIYRTGDLGQYGPEGELYFRGRKDFQIKYQGHRIELEEIEGAVAQVPGVERCCCLFQEERQRLWGFYQGTAEPEAVRADLARRLPGYMVPSALRRREAFPLNKNGKVDRQALLAGEVRR